MNGSSQFVYGCARVLYALLARINPPTCAAPADAPCPPMPGIATAPVKLTVSKARSSPGTLLFTTPNDRLLAAFRPTLNSLIIHGEMIRVHEVIRFQGTSVKRCPRPVTLKGSKDSP